MQGAIKRIGIGIGSDAAKVICSAQWMGPDIDIVFYCGTGSTADEPALNGVHVAWSDHPEQSIIDDLMAGRIGAAVRGTFPSNTTLRALKTATGVAHLERIALLETATGTRFLLAPVGVDEGWTVPEKLELIKKGRIIAKKFGLPDKVGVLSGGRLGDIGRHSRVDESIAEAERVARLGEAVHCEILIEDAVKTCGLVIAPDGICGNLIFRTLTLLGGGCGHGALVVNIDRIFVDTSRASPNYSNALLLAASLLE